MSAITYIVLIGFAIFGIQYWMKNKTYLFQAEDIARISKRHIRKGMFSQPDILNQHEHNTHSIEFLQHILHLHA